MRRNAIRFLSWRHEIEQSAIGDDEIRLGSERDGIDISLPLAPHKPGARCRAKRAASDREDLALTR